MLKEKHEEIRSCVDCYSAACNGEAAESPEFCPYLRCDDSLFESAESELRSDPESRRFSEAVCCDDVPMTRVEEVMEFARRLGIKKLGVATCAGLLSESAVLAKILRSNGFEVYGVCCKMGSLSKLDTGLSPEQLARFKNGPIMCNPIGQAMALNEAGTELNILMGLCVGHDTLFYKFCKGFCTVLVTKDRVLAHNPAGALYETGSFYRRLLQPGNAGSQNNKKGDK